LELAVQQKWEYVPLAKSSELVSELNVQRKKALL
jgi:hypothetical protein